MYAAMRLHMELQWGRDLSAAEGMWRRGRRDSFCSFNGAATFRPRKVLRVPARAGNNPASMGPRPFGRGRAQRLRPGQHSPDASMGPRPFGRGRRAGAPCGVTRTCSFNGAATFRPRKGSASTSGRGSQSGFNGAATFRPRKVALDRVLSAQGIQLQWGRDLSAAEGAQPEPDGAPRASMGPRPFGRGRRAVAR